MTTVPDIVSQIRLWLRDYPKYYTSEAVGNGFTYAYRLDAPLVKVDSSFVAMTELATPHLLVQNVDYTVDARNGILFLTNALADGIHLVVNFYAYEWFLDDDLTTFTNLMIGEYGQNRPGYGIANIESAEAEALGLGATVMALWSLMNELARDIDVRTFVDGTDIPVNQRFRQVQSMLMGFESMYKGKAAMLNVGLDRIEAFALRRVSLTTNRLVPLYLPREFDDLATPQRVYPPVDPMGNSQSATPSYHQVPGAVDPFLW